MKRRTLADLYRKGREVVFSDGEVDPETGEPYPPFTVYLRKLNDIETETALRKAQAAKAKVLLCRNQPDSDEYLSAIAEMERLGSLQQWAEFLADAEMMKETTKIEAELSDEDEWSNDNYLQGLFDAWSDTLSTQHFTEPTEESERVWTELQRFQQQFNDRVTERKAAFIAEFNDLPEEKLRDRMIKAIVDRRADFAWIKALRRTEIFLAARQEDRRTPVFEDICELDDLSDEMYLRLVAEFQAITVDVLEGKGLPPNPSSSPPSEQPEQPGTEPVSGPVVAGP